MKKPNPPDLDAIRSDAEVSFSSDPEAKAEVTEFSQLEDHRHGFIMHRLLEVAAFNENNQREQFGKRIFVTIVAWLFLVLIIVVIDGFNIWCFDESDNVIMLLLGTSTANVIGLLIIVLQYLFRSSALEVYFKNISNSESSTS